MNSHGLIFLFLEGLFFLLWLAVMVFIEGGWPLFAGVAVAYLWGWERVSPARFLNRLVGCGTVFLVPGLLIYIFYGQKGLVKGISGLPLAGYALVETLPVVGRMALFFLMVSLFLEGRSEGELLSLFHILSAPLRWGGILSRDSIALILMAIRFFPVLSQEWGYLVFLQGKRFPHLTFFQRGLFFLAAIIPFFNRMTQRSSTLAYALVERGFIGGVGEMDPFRLLAGCSSPAKRRGFPLILIVLGMLWCVAI